MGDSKAESEAKVTFTNIKIEKPDTFVFLGDASYIDDNGKVWTDLIDRIRLKDIIQVIKGNHEDQEENAEKAGQDMENWMPSLKETKNGAAWLSSKQVKNAYFINMNGQDLDYQYILRNKTQGIFISLFLMQHKLILYYMDIIMICSYGSL